MQVSGLGGAGNKGSAKARAASQRTKGSWREGPAPAPEKSTPERKGQELAIEHSKLQAADDAYF